MVVKHKKLAFTLVELLTVLAIITMLVALLIPALVVVRNMAKETQQKAQLTTIEMGLTAFKNDYGDYPPSDWQGAPPNTDYSGAQMLAEALVGWDLLGFHPKSLWDSAGTAYDPPTPDEGNLKERVGPYLELATASVFRLGNISNDKPGLFNVYSPLEGDTFVLCDVFAVRRITLPAGNIIKAGTPILYYKANPSWMNIDAVNVNERIYNAYDNSNLIALGSVTVNGKRGKDHLLGEDLDNFYLFDDEGGIKDRKVGAIPWPHRPDSYILISAGVDGLYGTSDDIRNF
jgi:type II secretory pathway pseudopilin PulG